MGHLYITYKGKTDTLYSWAKKLGVKYSLMKDRLASGWSIEKAIETPPRYTAVKDSDMIGKKFNKLTVVSFYKSINGRKYWNCICECGNTSIVCTRNLRSLRTISCGCLIEEHRYKKHGLTNTRLFTILKNMKGRCYNKNDKDYKNYGGRGITICDAWLDKENGMLNFYNWAINNGYSDNLSIDRIDFNGNYSPDNCRWVSVKVQSNNKRDNFYVTYNNEKKTVQEWSELFGINKATLRGRLLRGWDVKSALTVPTNSNRPLNERI